MALHPQYLPNPQGKGRIRVLDDLQSCKPTRVQSKTSHQWLADYFTSMLVLSANYKFSPKIGKKYYLYIKNDQLKLSLIEPREWKTLNPGVFFATCILQQDMCWSIKPKRNWQNNSILNNTIQKYQDAFLIGMNDEIPLVDKLPFFIEKLLYHQRLGANALSRSLKQSLELKFGKKEGLRLNGQTIFTKIIDNNLPLLDCSS